MKTGASRAGGGTEDAVAIPPIHGDHENELPIDSDGAPSNRERARSDGLGTRSRGARARRCCGDDPSRAAIPRARRALLSPYSNSTNVTSFTSSTSRTTASMPKRTLLGPLKRSATAPVSASTSATSTLPEERKRGRGPGGGRGGSASSARGSAAASRPLAVHRDDSVADLRERVVDRLVAQRTREVAHLDDLGDVEEGKRVVFV